jgi:hypothetical protein
MKIKRSVAHLHCLPHIAVMLLFCPVEQKLLRSSGKNPVIMGSNINTKTHEYCPNLSPDGKYFFYSSEYDVKWIASGVLQK